MINIFKRYQVGLKLEDLYPSKKDGFCDCGCGSKLTGKKKRWYSTNCQNKALINFWIIKGDNFTIRQTLYQIDKGFCRNCGVYSKDWHADHILPVFLGGSACGLENLQTLCNDCHKLKSYTESHLNTISSHAACMLDNRLVTALGAVSCEFPKQSIEIQRFGSTLSPSFNKLF